MKAIKIDDYKNHKVLDFDVIKRVLSGEKGLYEILMRRNNQKLYRVIRSYVKDEDLIKDIMQETYIKAYEKLHQYNQKAAFSTWLIRIGINNALQELRSKRHEIIKHPSTELNKINIIDLKTMNPEKAIVQQEAKWVLEKAISALPEKYRIIYMLREVENMEIKDIGDCLDLSTGNVKVRIHRSKQMLKDILYELSLKPNVFEFGFSKCDALVNFVMKRL